MALRTSLWRVPAFCVLTACGTAVTVAQSPPPSATAAAVNTPARLLAATAERHYKRGEEAFRNGRFEEAARCFAEARAVLDQAPPEVRAEQEVQAYAFELQGRIELLQTGLRQAALAGRASARTATSWRRSTSAGSAPVPPATWICRTLTSSSR